MLVDSLTGKPTPTKVIIEGKEWYVAKVEFGQTAGYRKTDLLLRFSGIVFGVDYHIVETVL